MLERYRQMVLHPFREFAEWGTRFGSVIHSVQFDLRFTNVPFTAQYIYKYLGLNPRTYVSNCPLVGGEKGNPSAGAPRFVKKQIDKMLSKFVQKFLSK